MSVALLAIAGASSPAQAAEVRSCQAGEAHAGADFYLPKKVAFDKRFDADYFVESYSGRGIGDIRVDVTAGPGGNPRAKELHYKNLSRNGGFEFWLSKKDGPTKFTLSWTEYVDEYAETPDLCRESLSYIVKPVKAWKPWVKFRASNSGITWTFKNLQTWCGSDKREPQVTDENYNLRVQGANGRVRMKIPYICDYDSKISGKRSGLWDLTRYSENQIELFYDFGRKTGYFPFKWSLYRGKKQILRGRFAVEVAYR